MACPTCNGTMELFNRDAVSRMWHCPRCGTMKCLYEFAEPEVFVPKLVERCRTFAQDADLAPQAAHLWHKLGIPESINVPENRT